MSSNDFNSFSLLSLAWTCRISEPSVKFYQIVNRIIFAARLESIRFIITLMLNDIKNDNVFKTRSHKLLNKPLFVILFYISIIHQPIRNQADIQPVGYFVIGCVHLRWPQGVHPDAENSLKKCIASAKYIYGTHAKNYQLNVIPLWNIRHCTPIELSVENNEKSCEFKTKFFFFFFLILLRSNAIIRHAYVSYLFSSTFRIHFDNCIKGNQQRRNRVR